MNFIPTSASCNDWLESITWAHRMRSNFWDRTNFTWLTFKTDSCGSVWAKLPKVGLAEKWRIYQQGGSQDLTPFTHNEGFVYVNLRWQTDRRQRKKKKHNLNVLVRCWATMSHQNYFSATWHWFYKFMEMYWWYVTPFFFLFRVLMIVW